MKYLASLLFVILFISASLKAQKVDADSLEFLLLTAKEDRKPELLIKLAEAYKDSLNSRSLKYADLALQLILGKNDHSENIDQVTALAKIYSDLIAFRQAIRCNQIVLQAGKTNGDSTILAEQYYILAGLNSRTGDYPRAMKNFLESLRIAESLEDTVMIGNIYASMARLNCFMKNYNKALGNLKEALYYAKQSGSKETLIKIYNEFGLIYDDLEEFDKSLDYHFKSLEIAQQMDRQQLISHSLNNIGLVYISSGDYEHAYDYYLRSMVIKERLNDKRGMVSGCINLATSLVKLGKYEEAGRYLERGLEISQSLKLKPLLMHIWETYYDLYKATGNYQKALDAYLLSNKYKDSIYSREKAHEIAELQAKYEMEKQQHELAVLKEKEKYQHLIRKVLIGGLVLLIIVTSVIILENTQKRKKDKIINLKQQQILKAELQAKKLKENEMRQEIRFKSRQLTTHALHMMQKNELLNDIISLSNELLKSPENTVKPKVRQLRQKLKQSLKTDNDWEVFKIQFEQVNPQFFKNLLNLCPGLSNYDLRHAALIKLNMNIKESASVLNLSPHSVKSARYRLKKKLSLKADDDLNDFIRNI